MKKILRPGCIALYFLTVVAFFLGGMTFAGMTDAAKDQGLASGAIVFMYGVYFAAAGLTASVVISYFLSDKSIKLLNIIVSFLILIIAGLVYYNYNERRKNKSAFQFKRNSYENINAQITPVSFNKLNMPDSSIGVGFFKPDFVNNKALYFYSNPYFADPTKEIPTVDSITFSLKDYGALDISYAPPWLVPVHMKLDYEILFFRIMFVSNNYIEIEVNEYDGLTTWVKREAGEIFYWPEFLLNVHSVELLNPSEQKIRIKPLNYSDEVFYKYEIIRPVLVNDEWMMVELYDDNYSLTGKGWLQWKSGDKLLISYSFLS
ncbi:MAG: hypothetical protein IPM38_16585 [Ignavibacteria bacterium]|nr:hypothetical protein [Ignavibacteria bacterium]